MTIASEITRINNNIAAAYTAANAKGATIPQTQNSANLATCISSITSGGGIDTRLIVGDVDANGNYKRLSDSADITGDITLSGIKSISSTSQAFAYKFALITSTSASDLQKPQSRGIVGVISFPDLETVSSSSVFLYCFWNQKITGVSFPKLATVGAGGSTTFSSAFSSAFRNCRLLTMVSFPALTTLIGPSAFVDAFNSCVSLTSLSFPALTTLTADKALASAFNSCVSLTSLSFPALTSNSFGSKTTQFNNMLSGVTGCTVHFPSNIQSTIGSWSSVTGGFSGTNTTVLFDLPATE